MKGGVRGLFSSASAFTGFVNRSLAKVSMDKSIIASQTKAAKHKPQHALQGLSFGLAELGKGVAKGVTGIVTKPIEGAMSDGAVGFVTGIGRGLVGKLLSFVCSFVCSFVECEVSLLCRRGGPPPCGCVRRSYTCAGGCVQHYKHL